MDGWMDGETEGQTADSSITPKALILWDKNSAALIRTTIPLFPKSMPVPSTAFNELS